MRVKPLLVVASAFLAWATTAGPAGAQPASEPCAFPEGGEKVRLEALDRHGDLRLADGRILRLAGLMPRQDEAALARFAAGIGPWLGRDLLLAALGGSDRWGRLPARLQVEIDEDGRAGPQDLTALLLGKGAGLRLPEPGQPECNAFWQVSERRALSARAPARTGPAAAGSGILDGHDPAAMKAQAGRLVVVEGRIASVGERTRRTYLNFSRRRGAGASIVLSRQLWRELQGAGWTASTLPGKRMRVRGVVEGRDSLLIEPSSRAALEMID